MGTIRKCTSIRRTGSALAAIILTLALSGCLKGLRAIGGAHHGLHRLRSGQCKRGAPLAGVYLPSRLHVKRSCITVSGTVDCLRQEPDGDIHIKLRVDLAYRRLLTPANSLQRCPGHKGPHLVLEIIPQNGQPPILDNSASLAGFVTPAAPRAGAHIKVTGPYVWDTNALHDLIFPGKHVANWAEIHPVWNITVTRRAR